MLLLNVPAAGASAFSALVGEDGRALKTELPGSIPFLQFLNEQGSSAVAKTGVPGPLVSTEAGATQPVHSPKTSMALIGRPFPQNVLYPALPWNAGENAVTPISEPETAKHLIAEAAVPLPPESGETDPAPPTTLARLVPTSQAIPMSLGGARHLSKTEEPPEISRGDSPPVDSKTVQKSEVKSTTVKTVPVEAGVEKEVKTILVKAAVSAEHGVNDKTRETSETSETNGVDLWTPSAYPRGTFTSFRNTPSVDAAPRYPAAATLLNAPQTTLLSAPTLEQTAPPVTFAAPQHYAPVAIASSDTALPQQTSIPENVTAIPPGAPRMEGEIPPTSNAAVVPEAGRSLSIKIPPSIHAAVVPEAGHSLSIKIPPSIHAAVVPEAGHSLSIKIPPTLPNAIPDLAWRMTQNSAQWQQPHAFETSFTTRDSVLPADLILSDAGLVNQSVHLPSSAYVPQQSVAAFQNEPQFVGMSDSQPRSELSQDARTPIIAVPQGFSKNLTWLSIQPGTQDAAPQTSPVQDILADPSAEVGITHVHDEASTIQLEMAASLAGLLFTPTPPRAMIKKIPEVSVDENPSDENLISISTRSNGENDITPMPRAFFEPVQTGDLATWNDPQDVRIPSDAPTELQASPTFDAALISSNESTGTDQQKTTVKVLSVEGGRLTREAPTVPDQVNRGVRAAAKVSEMPAETPAPLTRKPAPLVANDIRNRPEFFVAAADETIRTRAVNIAATQVTFGSVAEPDAFSRNNFPLDSSTPEWDAAINAGAGSLTPSHNLEDASRTEKFQAPVAPQAQRLMRAVSDGIPRPLSAMKIEIQPEGYGPIQIRISAPLAGADTWRVDIRTADPAARALLSNNVTDLQGSLKTEWVTVQNMPGQNTAGSSDNQPQDRNSGGRNSQRQPAYDPDRQQQSKRSQQELFELFAEQK